MLELVNIAANKNTIPGDKSALIPHGIRVGSPAMTTRGLSTDDFKVIVGFMDEAVNLTIKINNTVAGKKLKDFKLALGDGSQYEELEQLRLRVVEFSKSFPVVGYKVEEMKYI